MKKTSFIYRLTAAVVVVALCAAVLAPLKSANAAQVSSRNIQMSNSTPGATNVTYKVSFIPRAVLIQAIVLDFCLDTPLVGSASCTYPASINLGAAPSVTVNSGVTTTGWATTNSLAGASAGKQVLFLTNAAQVTPTGGATPLVFTITGVTNPSTAISYYARIATFDTTAHATAEYTAPTGTTRGTTLTDLVDYGGVALSTANAVSVSATIMETLLFCVSKLAPGPTCGTTGQAVTTPTLALGHGSPLTLDTSTVDTDTAYTQLSTNAIGGAVVALKVTSSGTCSGLSRNGGGSCDIPASGALGAITAGTAEFGLNVATGTGGTGAVTANANYGPAAGNYGMGVAAPFGAYGDPIEQSGASPAPCSGVNSLLTYAATTSPTTPAGVYTAAHSLIATGTF